MRIDAVIVDYGTPALADACFDSLLDHRDHFASADVIDAKALGLSYAKACNQGLRDGGSEIVLCLNADTRLLEAPTAVLDLFREYPAIGVIGPRQVDDDGHLTHAGIFGRNEQPQHRLWQAPLAFHDQETSERARDAVMVAGSVMFARRTVWEQQGGFDERLPHYYEDTLFCLRARARGHRVVYTGATTWIHHWNQSTKPSLWKADMMRESKLRYQQVCREEGIAHEQ